MNVGYARVSTSSQSLENQIEQRITAGWFKNLYVVGQIFFTH